jgi:hypothetical protein
MAGRARFGSKLGLILSGVGSAVGLGNIWRFPQVTSSEGGAAFLFIYLPLVAFLSFPLILAEMSLGQKGQGSPFRTVKNVAGDKWGWVGGFLILATVLFMSYYTIIGGLTLKYAIFGAFQDALTNPEPFLAASNEGPSALLMHGVFTAIGVALIGYFGVPLHLLPRELARLVVEVASWLVGAPTAGGSGSDATVFSLTGVVFGLFGVYALAKSLFGSVDNVRVKYRGGGGG